MLLKNFFLSHTVVLKEGFLLGLCTLESLLAMCLGEPYGILGIESGLPVCKTSTFTPVLSLQTQFMLFLNIILLFFISYFVLTVADIQNYLISPLSFSVLSCWDYKLQTYAERFMFRLTVLLGQLTWFCACCKFILTAPYFSNFFPYFFKSRWKLWSLRVIRYNIYYHSVASIIYWVSIHVHWAIPVTASNSVSFCF